MSKVMYYVRRANYGDIKVLVTLLKELYRIERDFPFNATRQQAGLRRLLKETGSVVLVAEQDGLIVGMCTVQTLVSTAEGGWVAVLEDMIVHDKFQGQGIGTELLNAAEQWAVDQRCSRIQLIADSRNQPALGFYADRGWQDTHMVWRRKYLPPA